MIWNKQTTTYTIYDKVRCFSANQYCCVWYNFPKFFIQGARFCFEMLRTEPKIKEPKIKSWILCWLILLGKCHWNQQGCNQQLEKNLKQNLKILILGNRNYILDNSSWIYITAWWVSIWKKGGINISDSKYISELIIV